MGAIRRAFGCTAIASLAAAVFCGIVKGADAEPITLRLHTFDSPRSIAVRLFLQPWTGEIEERSGGRLEIRVFPVLSSAVRVDKGLDAHGEEPRSPGGARREGLCPAAQSLECGR